MPSTTIPRRPFLHRRAVLSAATALLGGCAATAPTQHTLGTVRAQVNPLDTPQRTVTGFTPALRCMDEWMFQAGTRDVTLMMEEMRDATQKVPISARDMMTSAISEMSRRSRAVRLSVFGSDQGNLVQLLQQAQKTQAFQVLPEYNIRGTVSQFDENVQRRGASLGLLAERLGLRLGQESRFSVLAFDAAVVHTESLTLVPGVSSKNTTVLTQRSTSAGDGQGRVLGVGAVFSFEAARAEGQAQAARNMIELAAVELVGKLVRAPYWQCLGLSDDHPEVQREIDDWYHGMDEAERVVFVKSRWRERRWWNAALDDSASPAFDDTLSRTRQALGLPAAGALDAAYFQALVTRRLPAGPLGPQRKGAGAVQRVAAAPAAADAAAPTAPTAPEVPAVSAAAAVPDDAPPARVFVQAGADGRAELRVLAASAGHLSCFAQDPQTQALRRIYPNRFERDSRVEAGAQVALPGKGRFTLDARQHFACVHTPTDLYNDLPPPLRWGDFDEVRVRSLDQVAQAFSQAAGHAVPVLQAQPLPR